MNKRQTTRGNDHLLYIRALLLLTMSVLTIVSCSGDKTSPPKPQNARPGGPQTTKLQWADMIMGRGDSTQGSWLDAMNDWPDFQKVIVDSTMRTQLADLTFAFHTWIFKNKELEYLPNLAGCQVNVIVAARHVPDHMLMKDFSIDSVLLFRPGETTPAGRRLMFPARRKYLAGVWQVEFATSDVAYKELDFPEGTPLKPDVFVSWRGKSLFFALPPSVYEYIEAPTPPTN
ncbi:hypothetical protein ACFLQW_00900 [Candidatus Zixiibacteriota bacterium]